LLQEAANQRDFLLGCDASGAGHLKEVDAAGATVRFWQKVYDDQGKLVATDIPAAPRITLQPFSLSAFLLFPAFFGGPWSCGPWSGRP
jgi:YD repeat-containing protein